MGGEAPCDPPAQALTLAIPPSTPSTPWKPLHVNRQTCWVVEDDEDEKKSWKDVIPHAPGSHEDADLVWAGINHLASLLSVLYAVLQLLSEIEGG